MVDKNVNLQGLEAAPVVLPELDAWRDGARFALEAVSKVDSICWLTDSMKVICIKNAADAVIAERDRQRALLATATGLPAQADKQRIDALMHFMQANCYNLELNSDETRNILFNLEQIRAWRSGMHDDYVERLYGRKIHSMGGQEQGEGTSTGCAAGGPALAADLPAVVAPQAQADARDAERWRESLSHVYSATKGNGQPIFGISLSPSESLYRSKLTSADQFTKDIDAAIAAAKGE